MNEEKGKELQEEAVALMDTAVCFNMDEELSEEALKEVPVQLMIRLANWFVQVDEMVDAVEKSPEWSKLIGEMKFVLTVEEDLNVETLLKLSFDMNKCVLAIAEEQDLENRSPEWLQMIDRLKLVNSMRPEEIERMRPEDCNE